MAKRIKIAILYNYDEGWIAGSYYILNLIHALGLLEDRLRPEITILAYSQEEFNAVKITTAYPYLKFHQLYEDDIWGSNFNFSERVINKIFRLLSKKNLIERNTTRKRLKIDSDFFFPASDHIYFSEMKNKIFWIPDFQEYFLPHFFSEKVIAGRKQYQQNLVKSGAPIIFSSNNALQHFRKIYPDARSKGFVLQFAVTHPSYATIQINTLLEKFKISQKYFFCPNQFWAHKNHIVVLKALNHLKEKGNSDILVVFSGKENDPRNPEYFRGLLTYIEEHNITNNVRFLGFIDRAEQLQLMNHAISVIQPSLFEGWSTVIEDAKAMNQYVIASGIEVHKEQLVRNGSFFDPENAAELAEIMDTFYKEAPLKSNADYKKQNEKFGETFIHILTSIDPHINLR